MNVQRAVAPVLCLLAFAGSFASRAFAQHHVSPDNMYARIYAIVPMVGSGTWDDPRRPMFAPIPHQITASDRTGILAFNHVESDDGKLALIEIVMADRPHLAQVTTQISTQMASVEGFQLFDRATAPQATIQAAFQKYRKNFDITKFRLVVP